MHGAPRKAERAQRTQKGRQRNRQALSSAKSLFWLTTMSRHAKRQVGRTEDKGRGATEMKQSKLATISGGWPREKATGLLPSRKRTFCVTRLARSPAQSRARPTHAERAPAQQASSLASQKLVWADDCARFLSAVDSPPSHYGLGLCFSVIPRCRIENGFNTSEIVVKRNLFKSDCSFSFAERRARATHHLDNFLFCRCL